MKNKGYYTSKRNKKHPNDHPTSETSDDMKSLLLRLAKREFWKA